MCNAFPTGHTQKALAYGFPAVVQKRIVTTVILTKQALPSHQESAWHWTSHSGVYLSQTVRAAASGQLMSLLVLPKRWWERTEILRLVNFALFALDVSNFYQVVPNQRSQSAAEWNPASQFIVFLINNTGSRK